jgi:O-antigen/teichoic acid export membrane protein
MIKSRALSWTDITVLGFFVSSSTIGVYQVTWTIAMTLQILGKAISRNLFPEVSDENSSDDSNRINLLAQQSFVYAGLIPIPGIVGATLLGERVLAVYGKEFQTGAFILIILTGASLLRAYEGSVYSIANGIDKPQISFISNFLFILANLGLNVILVYYFGAVGAAIGTLSALFLGLTVAYWFVGRHIEFDFPIHEIMIQVVAALVMGGVVFSLRTILSPLSFIELLLVVGIGATVYFSLVLALSKEIRTMAVSAVSHQI